MATDFLDFLPLTAETISTIRARLNVDANAGVAPDEPGYLDTTEGGFFYDLTQAPALEAERLWDFLATEVVAAAFVQAAWGSYLDLHGEQLGVERKDESRATGSVTFTAPAGTVIPRGTQVAQPSPSTDADEVIFETTADATVAATSVTVGVQALVPGPQANIAANQITLLVTPIAGVTAVTNATPTSGGEDVETDESYQRRLLLEWQSPGTGGNVAQYERWALAWPGVGYVKVNPAFSGGWTVQVVIADTDRNPSSSATVTALKQWLDPGDGTGMGEAPVGANVTVVTVTNVTVPVSATVTFEPGFSLDGANGTVARRAEIEAAIKSYIDELGPGDDVLRARVQSMFFTVPGVLDVASVALNGVQANFVVGDTQVALTGTVTLT